MYKFSVLVFLAICACGYVCAIPVGVYDVPVAAIDSETSVPVTLIDVDSDLDSFVHPEVESQRTARGLGLGLLSAKFGGLGGGFGHGLKGFGSFGGLGFGSLHGLGGGFGFKPFLGGKKFLF